MVIQTKNNVLWLFYLISLKSFIDNSLSFKSLDMSVNYFTKKILFFSNIEDYYKFFSNIELNGLTFVQESYSSSLDKSIFSYLSQFSRYISKNNLNFFKNSFIKLFYIINIFFLPNFLIKKFDIIGNLKLGKKRVLSSNRLLFTFFSYYKLITYDKNYYTFLKFLPLFYLGYLYNYVDTINFYSIIFENLFYRNFFNFFAIKNYEYMGLSWNYLSSGFILSIFSSEIVKDDNYKQKNLFSVFSSIRFIKLLNLGKWAHTMLPVKVVMVQHLRRMMLGSNITSFFLFLKSYIKDFSFLFNVLISPLNEIFVNPISSKLSVICDIKMTLDNYNNFNIFFSKYKEQVGSFFFSDNCDDNYGSYWNNFSKDFFSKLTFYNSIIPGSTNVEKIFLRYFFDCNFVFIFKKRMLPLRHKSLQSIKRRRYKQIVKTAKRRFWVF